MGLEVDGFIGSDAVVVATEWDEFASIDLAKLAEHMKGILVLDGRGVISESSAALAGLKVAGFGW